MLVGFIVGAAAGLLLGTVIGGASSSNHEETTAIVDQGSEHCGQESGGFGLETGQSSAGGQYSQEPLGEDLAAADIWGVIRTVKQELARAACSLAKRLREGIACAVDYINNLASKLTNPDAAFLFWLKRIHSLLGVVALGGFLIVHFINNSLSAFPDRYNQLIEFFEGMPGFWLVETIFIFIPFALHALLGIYFIWRGDDRVILPLETGRRYLLQRITGLLTLGGLLVHLATTRFLKHLPFREVLGLPARISHQTMRWYLTGPLAPIMLPVYAGFIVSAAWHLANGLWTAGVTWGILATQRAQAAARMASNVVFIALAAWGATILSNFLS